MMNKSDFKNRIQADHKSKLNCFAAALIKKIEAKISEINYKAPKYTLSADIDVPYEYSGLPLEDFTAINAIITAYFKDFSPTIVLKNTKYEDSHYDTAYYINCGFTFAY